MIKDKNDPEFVRLEKRKQSLIEDKIRMDALMDELYWGVA